MIDRDDFIDSRQSGLGGSDIGAILSLSPYRTPVDVWSEKTGRANGQEETLQMRFGTYAEAFVAREYTAKTGNAVQRFTSMLRHATAPVLGNVDRLVIPRGAKIASHKTEIRTDLRLGVRPPTPSRPSIPMTGATKEPIRFRRLTLCSAQPTWR